ncbi:MAG: hypothetical protein LBR30_05875 [Clostridioides sp.]|nr:hypothetical protein [Clostridioides sp.]
MYKERFILGDSIETVLRQLGATSIKKVLGNLYFIEFYINEDYKVTYSYNINPKNKYFLQRIDPYPIPKGVFKTEEDIVSFIKNDLEKFRNAANSKNFETFVAVSNDTVNINYLVENLFFNHNVDKNYLQVLKHKIEDVIDTIEEIESKSKKINDVCND